MENTKGIMKITLDPKLTGEPAFIATNATGRGTWLNLLLWCADQENGGVIKGAASWSSEAWGMLGVVKECLPSAGRLLLATAEDIRVLGYPTEQEEAARAKRAGGKVGGLARVNNSSIAHAKLKDSSSIATRTPLIEPVKKPIQTNEEWLADIKSNPLFKSVDVDREREKAALWCQNNRRQMTRKFFLNWLNKAEQSLPANGHAAPERKREVRF